MCIYCYVFVIIEADACTITWGAEKNGTHFSGIWIEEEAELGINKLELLKSWKSLSKWFSLITYFITYLSDHAHRYFKIYAAI